MTEQEHPTPTQGSRAIVRGSYDLHVHVAPDVMRRRITDIELASRYGDYGLSGFVLKSHYASTAERASVVRAAVPGVGVHGAITLNGSVGGMNASAVEIAALGGAKLVWMPTVDSVNQRTTTARDPEGAKPPMWAKLQADLIERGIGSPPVLVADDDGEILPQVHDVLRTIARHDIALATGHLSRDEILKLVDAAVADGVRRIIVTHPEFTSQRLNADDQRELAQRGAVMERCFTTPYTGKVAWSEMIANIRAAGPENSFLSSDLGQPFNPPVEDGLALMAQHLREEGFTADEIHRMAVINPARLIGEEPW
jgi:hypothetical protein